MCTLRSILESTTHLFRITETCIWYGNLLKDNLFHLSWPPIGTWILRWIIPSVHAPTSDGSLLKWPSSGWIVNICNHCHLFEPEYYGEFITNFHAPSNDGPLLKWPSTGWIVNTCNHGHLFKPEYYGECIAGVVSFSDGVFTLRSIFFMHCLIFVESTM